MARTGRNSAPSRYLLKAFLASRHFKLCLAITIGAFLIWAVLALTAGANSQQIVTTGILETPSLGTPSIESKSDVISQGSPIRQRIPTEIVTILPDGFDLQEIKRRQGAFFLMVDNRSGLKNVSLRLDREFGNRLREVLMSQANPDWDDLVDLPPGQYLLTEANHPDWTCRITIIGN